MTGICDIEHTRRQAWYRGLRWTLAVHVAVRVDAPCGDVGQLGGKRGEKAWPYKGESVAGKRGHTYRGESVASHTDIVGRVQQ